MDAPPSTPPQVVQAAADSLQRQLCDLSDRGSEASGRGLARSGASGTDAVGLRQSGGSLTLEFNRSAAAPPTSARSRRRKSARAAEAEPKAEREASAVRRGLRAASYTVGGEDWARLFKRIEPRRGAGIRLAEFSAAVRRHVKAADGMRERDLRRLFAAADSSGSGVIHLSEWEAFLRAEGEPSAPRAAPTAAAPGAGDLVLPTALGGGSVEQVPIGSNRAGLEQIFAFFQERQRATAQRATRRADVRSPVPEGMTQHSFLQFCREVGIAPDLVFPIRVLVEDVFAFAVGGVTSPAGLAADGTLLFPQFCDRSAPLLRTACLAGVRCSHARRCCVAGSSGAR